MPNGDSPDSPPQIHGYDLQHQLGAGAMGTVWAATEHRFDRPVAIKIQKRLAGEEATVVREAMLLAKVNDPAIVRVIDYGVTQAGDAYFAMELIAGTTLAAVMREGPMPPYKALPIFRDIARGLAIAHEHGIVHRDIKPTNLMVDSMGRGRILDFGIATTRAEAVDPLAGMVAGSMQYGAPEQLSEAAVTPATDVHAFGLVLYHALTAVAPFGTGSFPELVARILRHEIEAPSKRVAGIDPDLDALVLRCVQKQPANRFADGHALMQAIEDLATGRRPSALPKPLAWVRAKQQSTSGLAPVSEARKTYEFEFRLRASGADLWPLVANTDTFNRAVGLPKPIWTHLVEGGEVVASGESQAFGMTQKWREYPFEWIHEQEHRVFRKFSVGPLEALWNRVTLERATDAADGSQTLLRHEIHVSPRSRLGALAASFEIEQRLRRSMQETYLRMDAVAAQIGVAGYEPGPALLARKVSTQERELLATKSLQLEARGVDRAIVKNLRRLLLEGPDMAVVAIRPKLVARDWAVDLQDVIEAFSVATECGLLEAVWDAICPVCQVAHERAESLGQLGLRASCKSCGKDFERDLATNVELVYRVHPSVRTASSAFFCVGSPAERPHILFQQVLMPGETRELRLSLPRGTYLFTCHDIQTEFHVSPFGFADSVTVVVAANALAVAPSAAASGTCRFQLCNDRATDAVVRLETRSLGDSAWSALEALSNPKLRMHCSPHLVAPQQPLPVSSMVHLAIVAVWRRDLSDLARFAQLSQLDDLIQRSAATCGGQSDGSPLARGRFVLTFPDLLSAGRVALLLRAESHAFEGLELQLAIHQGGGFVFARGDVLEFFGESIRRVEALPSMGELVLSDAAATDPQLNGLLRDAGYTLQIEEVPEGSLRGLRVSVAKLDKAQLRARAEDVAAKSSAAPAAAALDASHTSLTRVGGVPENAYGGSTEVLGRK